MHDRDCVAFLQWALPRMGFRWPGFRKVRRQVCKRIGRRLRDLDLEDLAAYRRRLEEDPAEWRRLDDCCRITISRFFRDRQVFRTLGEQILPQLAHGLSQRGAPRLRIWSAGCGAGEEPYTLSILYRVGLEPARAPTRLEILGTDSDDHQLARARAAVFPAGCLRDLPADLRRSAFEELEEETMRLRDAYREDVEFRCQDLRRVMPAGPFHLILCRNLAFTYFVEELQRQILHALLDRLAAGGYLVVGLHERLPPIDLPLEPWPSCRAILGRPGAQP